MFPRLTIVNLRRWMVNRFSLMPPSLDKNIRWQTNKFHDVSRVLHSADTPKLRDRFAALRADEKVHAILLLPR